MQGAYSGEAGLDPDRWHFDRIGGPVRHASDQLSPDSHAQVQTLPNCDIPGACWWLGELAFSPSVGLESHPGIANKEKRDEVSTSLYGRKAWVVVGYILDGSRTPVEAVVVALVGAPSDAAPLERLVFGQRGQNAKNDRHARVEAHTHEARAARFRNVLKVHRRSLDQHTDADHSIQRRLGGLGRRPGDRSGRLAVVVEQRGGTHEVRHVGRGLHLRARDEPRHAVRQLPRARHTLDHNVFRLDARLGDGLDAALDERRDALLVPSSMHNADAQLVGAGEGCRRRSGSLDARHGGLVGGRAKESSAAGHLAVDAVRAWQRTTATRTRWPPFHIAQSADAERSSNSSDLTVIGSPPDRFPIRDLLGDLLGPRSRRLGRPHRIRSPHGMGMVDPSFSPDRTLTKLHTKQPVQQRVECRRRRRWRRRTTRACSRFSSRQERLVVRRHAVVRDHDANNRGSLLGSQHTSTTERDLHGCHADQEQAKRAHPHAHSQRGAVGPGDGHGNEGGNSDGRRTAVLQIRDAFPGTAFRRGRA
ncbi:hypothetical protein L1887_55521 [Cichorium endivia]|nr:hypothetical protein L1887_55521 [Cichorium endivia]